MPLKNTFKFFVSKAKPILKKTASETAYATLGGVTGGYIIHKKNKLHRQTKKKLCLSKNRVKPGATKGQKYKKLRDYNKCLKK